MFCPHCGVSSKDESQKVTETRRTDDGRIERRRRCVGCGQSYRTIEHLSDGGLRVRKSDGRVLPFSSEAIVKSLTEASVRKYKREDIEQLIDAVIADVYPVAEHGVVASSVIGESVLRNFRKFDEASQIRFAIVHLGRVDRSDGRAGWSHVDDMRRWLAIEYPELKYAAIPARIERVVKRNGEVVAYSRKNIEDGVIIAGKGRGSELEVEQLAAAVATAVEDEIGDQPIVTSGQIASEVMRSLRNLSPIVYMRFASTAKSFRSAADYEGEAIFLRRTS